MIEVWKDIPGFAGYRVSNFGNVCSRKQLLKPSLRPTGHLVVGLDGQTIYVHRLVMLAFVGPRPTGAVILHLNHTPADNCESNLRYGTVSENLRMDFEVGTRNHKGERAPAAKLSDSDVSEIRASKLSTIDLAEIYQVAERYIR